MNFTPLDILYIVLAFCALWLSAGIFWIIWQAGGILRSVGDTLELAQEKIARIESAITAIKSRFESITSASTMLMEGFKKIMEFAGEKREEMSRRRTARRAALDEAEDEA